MLKTFFTYEEQLEKLNKKISNSEFTHFKASLSKLIKTALKQCPHLAEEQLLDSMRFPSNWNRITRYGK